MCACKRHKHKWTCTTKGVLRMGMAGESVESVTPNNPIFQLKQYSYHGNHQTAFRLEKVGFF